MIGISRKLWSRRALGSCLILAACWLFSAQSVLAAEFELGEPGFILDVPSSWQAKRHPANTKLRGPVVDSQGQPGDNARAQPPVMNITTEVRLDHEGAVRRLLEISGVRGAEWDYLEIAGWPALEQKFVRLRPQANRGEVPDDEEILVIQTVVAADNVVVRMETWLPPNASPSQTAEIRGIGRSLSTPMRGIPAQVAEEIEGLRRGKAPMGALPEPPPPVSAPLFEVAAAGPASEGLKPLEEAEQVDAGYSVPVSTQGGRDSELEIAVSADGRDVVIGSNLWWYFSPDAGQTWTLAATGGNPFTGNDPSVAWGQSGGAQGTFYGANIASPSTGMRTSTDGGANWVNAPAVYTCGQNGDAACSAAFPDQHHIVADRWNVTAGGDQVYSAWRHLDGNWGIVCSQDSAQTWSANAQFVSGDLPKPGVGPDGMVYVIYLDGDDIMLDKYLPCEVQTNPMSRVAGFPVTIRSNARAVACPTPGLDRCNRRNTLSGITVAVDDTNSNHVYVTYAINTATEKSPPDFFEGSPVCNDQNLCNENIIVQDSLDGGASWPSDRRVAVNTGVTARRFMPWLCTIGGSAYVSWYDRRAAFPGGNTRSNNSLTDFYAGSASLDAVGGLQSDGEFQVNDLDTEDAQCEAGFATGTAGSWPSATDRPRDSEDCSVQPQLGGSCGDRLCQAGTCVLGGGTCTQNSDCPGPTRCDYSACGGQGNNNGSAACACGPGFTCDQSRGSPKYGDYNGNACAAGRLYMTWASAEAPLAFPAATDIDSLFSSEVVCCVPQIQVPGGVDFGDVCESATQKLEVCNTGKENLQVVSIDSSSERFEATDPLGGWPVVISPDFCFPFQVTYDPDGTGSDTGTLTVNSNDPINPALEVPVEATVPPPDINTAIANSGFFGNVCKGEFADLDLTLFNQGACNLTISSIELAPAEGEGSFILPVDLDEPLVLSPDADFTYPVRYAPTECSDEVEEAQIIITSDDPDEGTEYINISGSSPCPNLVIDPAALSGDSAFPATVVDTEGTLGCYSERTTVLRNNGLCPLTIDNVTATGDDFTVMQPTTFPIILPSGEETLEVTVRFTPKTGGDPLFPDETLGTLSVTSDDPGTPGEAELCGENVAQSGIRVLATDITSGTPVIIDSVDKMTVKSKGKGIPGPINLQFADVEPQLTTICGNDVNWHLDIETLPAVESTGSQGGKSSYTVSAMDGNLQDGRSFSLDQCEFKEFQLELRSDDGGDAEECNLLPKGAACEIDSECCSGKCKGPDGGKSCK